MPCSASSSPKHDGDDAGFGLLADQFGLGPVVEIAQGAHDRRAPGHAAHLRALLLVDMRDVGRGDRPRCRSDDAARLRYRPDAAA